MACNEAFLGDANQVEYAICIDSSADRAEACPITSFAFTLSEMTQGEAAQYQQAENVNPQSTSKFYFSKSTPNHAIDEVAVGSNTPCWNENQTSKAANQHFYYAELLSTNAVCSQENAASYRELSLSPGQSLTEFSL